MALSAKDLIKKKQLITNKKDKQIEIEVPDTGTFLFRLPTIEDWEDAEAYSKSVKKDSKANDFLIHTCCIEPNLRDSELLEAYDVKEPIDIVSKVFLVGEVASISKVLVEKAGFDTDALGIVDKAKN